MAQTPYSKSIVVLIGPPGAGKGSQAKRLAQAFNWPLLSIGALLREISTQETIVGQQVRHRLATGKLMENGILAEIIRNRTCEEDCKDSYLIDGYPRNAVQAQWLEEWSSLQGKGIVAVHLSIPDYVARIRVLGRKTCPDCGSEFSLYTKPPSPLLTCDSCGTVLVTRDDAAIVDKRLTVYEAETLPILAYYHTSGRLVSVNAALPEPDVFHTLLKELSRHGTS
jgi:adenylate kinase